MKSIHVNRVPVRDVCRGQTFTVCIGGRDKRTIPINTSPAPAAAASTLASRIHSDDFLAPSTCYSPDETEGMGREASPPQGEEDDTDSLTSGGSSSNTSTLSVTDSSFLLGPSLLQGLLSGSRQGKFLLSMAPGSPPPQAYMEFDAEVLILHHPNRYQTSACACSIVCPNCTVLSSISINYEPVVHVGVVRQTARLVAITKGDSLEMSPRGTEMGASLSTGEKAVCRCGSVWANVCMFS